MHDQVIQDLFSINYQLECLEVEQEIMPPLRDELADVRTSIREIVSSLRQVCGELRPPTIDSLGLGAALLSYSRDWSERNNIEVILDIDPKLGRLPEATELSIFRIVQEGLNNVKRHARASKVYIKMVHTTPRMLSLSIADDGIGIDEGLDINSLAGERHYGLLGISERVALLGGRIRITRQPEGGADLQIEIPHPRVREKALSA